MSTYSYQEDENGGVVDRDQLVFLERIGSNSVTVDGHKYCLLRLHGKLGASGVTSETTYVLDLEIVASMVSVLSHQAVRDGQGNELLSRVVRELDRLRDAYYRSN